MKFLDKLKRLFHKDTPAPEIKVDIVRGVDWGREHPSVDEFAALEPPKPTRREISMAEKVFWHRIENATSKKELIRLAQNAELLPVFDVCWDIPKISIIGKGQFSSSSTVRKYIHSLRKMTLSGLRSHIEHLGGKPVVTPKV